VSPFNLRVWQIASWLNPKLCAQTDKTFLAAALRETHEEVGIVPDQVEILGQVGPSQLSLGGLRVWPYVVRDRLVIDIIDYRRCPTFHSLAALMPPMYI
jgi:8-oxo-dGTP pyrophosphatase MutT (NUDIX family)